MLKITGLSYNFQGVAPSWRQAAEEALTIIQGRRLKSPDLRSMLMLPEPVLGSDLRVTDLDGSFIFGMEMRYTKPALTFDAQVDLLLRRGIVGGREAMKSRLSSVSYYRLSAYWYPFRKLGPTPLDPKLDDFLDGTAFDTIWDRYVFDQKLRLILMEALERIEVAARTQIAYTHAHAWTPDAYAITPGSLPRLQGKPGGPPSHDQFWAKLRGNIRKNKDSPFVRHFQERYPDSGDFLPIWMAAEIMSMGDVATMYEGFCERDRSAVSAVFEVTNPVLLSWLKTLVNVRNICAHHSRLWNRTLAKIPQLPPRGTHASWYTVAFSRNRVFAALTICSYLLAIISPTSTWSSRVVELILKDHPGIPTTDMGFPPRWQEFPLWVEAARSVS